MYIGKAGNLKTRWKRGHHKAIEICLNGGVYIGWVPFDHTLLSFYEDMYIEKYKPLFNEVNITKAKCSNTKKKETKEFPIRVKLAEALVYYKVSSSTLAAHIGVSTNLVSSWKCGRTQPLLPKLDAIMNCLATIGDRERLKQQPMSISVMLEHKF